VKDRRKRSERGERQPIKIPRRNLSYIPESTRCPRIILMALETGLGTTAKTQNGASKTMSEIDEKNRIEKQLMSSQAFHRTAGGRVREIIMEERFETRKLESFDPVTHELYRPIPTIIHKQYYKVLVQNVWQHLKSRKASGTKNTGPAWAVQSHRAGTLTGPSRAIRYQRKRLKPSASNRRTTQRGRYPHTTLARRMP
jgi:hypothetical protein